MSAPIKMATCKCTFITTSGWRSRGIKRIVVSIQAATCRGDLRCWMSPCRRRARRRSSYYERIRSRNLTHHLNKCHIKIKAKPKKYFNWIPRFHKVTKQMMVKMSPGSRAAIEIITRAINFTMAPKSSMVSVQPGQPGSNKKVTLNHRIESRMCRSKVLFLRMELIIGICIGRAGEIVQRIVTISLQKWQIITLLKQPTALDPIKLKLQISTLFRQSTRSQQQAQREAIS